MGAKVSSVTALTDKQILDVCYYTQRNVTFEVLLDDAGWVGVDWLQECVPSQIEKMMTSLAEQYPNERIRVIDKTTGRMVDFA